MVLRLTPWDIAAILEKHLARLYTIQKNIIKSGGSGLELDRSIEEIKFMIENLSGEAENDME